MKALHFTPARPEDCVALAALAARSFTDTFGHLYTPENLASHLAKFCSEAYFREALAAGDHVILVKENGALIGYSKLGRVRLPVQAEVPNEALEIHHLYIDASYHGRGYGKQLLQHVLALPTMQHAPHIYLGVWEENLRAQALYRQYGFTAIGQYLYQVGSQFDQELIMLRQQA